MASERKLFLGFGVISSDATRVRPELTDHRRQQHLRLTRFERLLSLAMLQDF
jgi:hypothetical protein